MSAGVFAVLAGLFAATRLRLNFAERRLFCNWRCCGLTAVISLFASAFAGALTLALPHSLSLLSLSSGYALTVPRRTRELAGQQPSTLEQVIDRVNEVASWLVTRLDEALSQHRSETCHQSQLVVVEALEKAGRTTPAHENVANALEEWVTGLVDQVDGAARMARLKQARESQGDKQGDKLRAVLYLAYDWRVESVLPKLLKYSGSTDAGAC